MKISEVCEKFDVNADTLRYYERVGLIPTVNRNSSGIRDYNEIDIEWVSFIKCMRNAGLTIEVLKEYVHLVQQGDATIDARKNMLKKQRDQLLQKMNEMKTTLDLLNFKIEGYENAVLEKEKLLEERN
ncbi:MAG: MerR family transcriptional regulator, aldehyde-responsive regulator [Chloroflexota bacterium]|nr:MerR family transcriptional regulator, aldehyde-responsive regulator [Chloroflexota bacterium]